MRAISTFSSLTLAAGALAQNASVPLTVPSNKPTSASPLANDLIGMSLEADRWNDWTGNLTHPNDFTYTLLDNLKQKTSVAPVIRVGGDTEDHLIWNSAVDGVQNVFPAVPAHPTSAKQIFPECSFGEVGGPWYRYSGNLPAGTHIIWGVNLRAGNASEAVIEVKEIEKAFSHDFRLKGVTLESVEIGNEPDNYGGANWSVSAYAQRYNEYVEAINQALGHSNLKYQVGAFSGGWTAVELVDTGLFQTTLGKSTRSISEHHYSNTQDFSGLPPSEWPAIAIQLINKSFIRGNFTRHLPSPQAAHSNGAKFYLGETNSAFGHGMPGVSNTAAAALWAIDYSLQAATIGVDRLYFHAGVGYNYSAFQPIDHIGINITDYSPTAKRHTQPLYTAFVALADAVGNHADTWVNEIAIDNDYLAAYAIWEGSKIARIMIINSVPWNNESTGTRPSISVDVLNNSLSSARLKRLSIPVLDSKTGITWGGQNWDSYSGKVQGYEVFEVPEKGGIVRLPASSAVLLYL